MHTVAPIYGGIKKVKTIMFEPNGLKFGGRRGGGGEKNTRLAVKR